MCIRDRVNCAPLFFIMGFMTIGSAGGFLKVTTWIANNTLPYLHGMTTTTAGLASYVLGALANFLLTPLAATTTMTLSLIHIFTYPDDENPLLVSND